MRSHFAIGGTNAADDKTVPTLSLDYCFMGADRDGDKFSKAGSPIVVVRDHTTGWVDAFVVPSKGTHEFAVMALARCIEGSGYGKLAIKSDGEPSIVALKIAAVDHLRAKLPNLEAVMQESGVGQSASNGVAERLVWEVTSLTRTLISAAAELHGVRVGPDHALNVWAVRHAGVLLSCAQRTRDDGRTAYERRSCDARTALPTRLLSRLCAENASRHADARRALCSKRAAALRCWNSEC